ncbi:MAG: DEAD/DEAH box helicase, partial [Verrucomicrobiota bacterium]
LDLSDSTWGKAVWAPAFSPQLWMQAPPVQPETANTVNEALGHLGQTHERCLPEAIEETVVGADEMVPHLVLKTFEGNGRGGPGVDPFVAMFQRMEVSYAMPAFRYGPVVVDSPGVENPIPRMIDGTLFRANRDLDRERAALQMLKERGLDLLFSRAFGGAPEEFQQALGFGEPRMIQQDTTDWIRFLARIPELEREGWKVEIDDSFIHELPQPDDWWADLDEGSGIEWMKFDYGVEISGQRISLLAALVAYIEKAGPSLNVAALRKAHERDLIALPVPDEDDPDRMIAIPARKLGEILTAVIEFFHVPQGDFKLPALAVCQAIELLPELARETSRRLRALGKKLAYFDGLKPVKVPITLKTELRPYQQDGLNWLQFLREYQLGGILADDMGLGKTIQTLAHLLAERRSGRMDLPVLIIAPTSVLLNWAAEAARFAPRFKVLPLQGSGRKAFFDRIAESDIVLTSYALLPRDEGVLKQHEYHYVILDEAQYIKNPKSKMAQAACALTARHRLCLTGTPIENHLGELWSQFHFLMPGFLGDVDTFRSVWQRPIEKGEDDSRRELLTRRVAPLLLRRTKEEVAKDLPPRTDMVRSVALDKNQTELYEAVRAAMDRRVRDAVKTNGMARSQIIILDALLKLRQICCHPKLLKTTAAKKAKKSAKLELFRDLVDKLVADGRRILIFSQFTSMISLIEECLEELEIEWVKLIGSTPPAKRQKMIQKFQGGEVPVFLISLKAGGSGLNLTAADTVIHYDPWWNPAV